MKTLPDARKLRVPSPYRPTRVWEPRPVITWEHLRYVLCIVVLSLLWVFPNPDSTSFREDPTAGVSGTMFQQLLWVAFLVFGLWSTHARLGVVRTQFDLTFTALFVWCAFTTIDALVPDVSVRRLILTIISFSIFCMMFAGVASLRNLLLLLLGMCIFETALKYFVVIAFPQLGRHPAVGPEPQLHGLWRGQYYHKNVAGAVCAIELMIIWGCRRIAPSFVLVPLAVLEGIFLVFSGSKTPLFLLGGVFIMMRFLLSLRGFPAIVATVLGAVAFLNTITLASLFSDTANALAAKLIGDVTFTGRIELWRFLIHYMDNHPFIGAGFQSFWQIGDLSPAVTEGNNWVVDAVYGHQGYLDTAVMIGIPGLILTLIFVVVRPAADLAGVADRRNPALEMFVMFWLFGLLVNGTESVLLARVDTTWLFLVAGLVGIRRLRTEAPQSTGRVSTMPSMAPALRGEIAPHR